MSSSVFFQSIGSTLELPDKFGPGSIATPAIINMLHGVLLARLRARINYNLEREKITSDQVPSTAVAIWSELSFDNEMFETDEDPIEYEAFQIAKEALIAALTAEGHVIPNTLDDHAKVLAQSQTIREQAKARIAARNTVAAEAIGRMAS